MSDEDLSSPSDGIHVRLAETPEEVRAAQRLRYEVFYKEFGAHPTAQMESEERDFDHFDDYTDHLIVVDPNLDHLGGVVGTYRVMRADAAKRAGRFYSSEEYDLTPLIQSGANMLEVGRSCVLEKYRTMPVLQLLWSGIAAYIAEHQIDLMFGCASLHGTDPQALASELSLLHHNHLATPELRPRALPGRYVDMNILPRDQIDARRVFMKLPPLIKGYLRVGAMIGDGAVVDEQFNTTDVCIVMPTYMVTDRYVKHYERELAQPIQRTPLGDAKKQD
jgi:L-ornithine Nalpha-acyltransferase